MLRFRHHLLGTVPDMRRLRQILRQIRLLLCRYPVSFRINGLTGNAADYKLFALGTDGRYHEVSDWHFDDAPARLSAKKVYTICLTAQDGGSFDLSPDAKEVTLSIVLAR